MNNREIIDQAKMLSGIPDETILKTYAEWKKAGFQVKKGSHAVLKVKLWKPKVKKEEENKVIPDSYFMVKSSLFTLDQVEKINN